MSFANMNIHSRHRLEPALPRSEALLPKAQLQPLDIKHHSIPVDHDAPVAALRVLAISLLKQIETLESQKGDQNLPGLNLQQQVHQFEAALIRSALEKTGGRQRRAARLLGVKVTTLNTKIKRLKIHLAPRVAQTEVFESEEPDQIRTSMYSV